MKRFFKILALCLWVMVTFFSPALCEGAFWSGGSPVGADQKEHIEEGLAHRKIEIIPPLNKLNFGFATYKGRDYHFFKSISPIFFQDKTLVVQVEKADFKDSGISLTLSHPVYGNGTITFFFEKDSLKGLSVQEIQEILLTPLTSENNQYVFCDLETRVCHIYTCNHLPPPERTRRMGLDEAVREGYKKCAFCFNKTLYVPDFTLETALAREWTARIGGLGPFLVDTDEARHLKAMGKAVLKNWPFPLMGYDYSFDLIQSDYVGAYAIPAGKVVVTTAFLETLEHDEEIEAMLVRAVAHIERRHALRQFIERTKDIEMEKLSKGIATAAGAVASALAGPMFEVLGMAGMIPSQAAPIRLLGYRPDFEAEADTLAALYFDTLGKDRNILCGFLKKMQFYEMTQQLNPVNEKEAGPAARGKKYAACHGRFKYFGTGGDLVIQREGIDMARLRLLFQSIFQGENELTLYVDNRKYVEINENTRNNAVISLSVQDRNGTHDFEYKPGTMLRDAWGVFLTFKRTEKNAPVVLEAVTSVTLSLRLKTGTEGIEEAPRASQFRFVPGTAAKAGN